MFTFQLRSGFLKQFADMQDIGKTPLTACRCQQVFCNVTRRHQRPQHRHNATFAPDLPITIELFDYRIPRMFVIIQRFNIQRIQPHH
ncbi:Uncharacterised protein [Shigella sonnei]|nr:Uncharacterised protein [Shigella sonnei]CSE98627.1 Uncharacterised protein [Shigella sonnei]CSF10734.1 Uncharacterised protein [Shigella sonnei]CSH21768.1 Uncharacterised protein [Shigella sonnei]CSP14122.1 Uncharacterised protein [Shigella sonnei]